MIVVIARALPQNYGSGVASSDASVSATRSPVINRTTDKIKNPGRSLIRVLQSLFSQ